MRMYDGSPREHYQEVLRSIGAYLDRRGMREVLVLEAPDGFLVQGFVLGGTQPGKWADTVGGVEKETVNFLDEDIGRFMDEAFNRRGIGEEEPPAGPYEDAFRVIGRWIDEEKPKDIFFFEQGGAFVVRLHRVTQSGTYHELAEFTADDIARLVAEGPTLRIPAKPAGAGAPGAAGQH